MPYRLQASWNLIQEAKNIIDQVYYPLSGFVDKEDLARILKDMRLKDGSVWPIPIIFDLDGAAAQSLKNATQIIVNDPEGKASFIVIKKSIYRFNKKEIARRLFATEDVNHPGVKKILELKPFFLAGTVKPLPTPSLNKIEKDFSYLPPEETRKFFKSKNWQTVAAFQTRNPPHRSHEFLQQQALKKTDGLLIQPIIGEKKEGDFKNQHIFNAYKILVDKYFPPQKTFFNILPTFMRYAGPREAIFHALIRRNFGCTHMIIGRDHAGVGNYYAPYEAQQIFDNFTKQELGIEIFKFPNAFYCFSRRRMIFENLCDPKCQFLGNACKPISGTFIRESLIKNQPLPATFMRKEIFSYLEKNKDTLFV